MLLQSTFLSLWYWVFAVLFWGVICNYTYGIPNELLMRARRGGLDADLFDRYARRNLAMFSRGIKRQGIYVGSIAAFIVAMIATLAIRSDYEAAMGLLVLLAPMMALSAWGGWMIQKLDRDQPEPERLRRYFLRTRRVTGIVAGLSIVAGYWVATARHGPGWTDALFRGF